MGNQILNIRKILITFLLVGLFSPALLAQQGAKVAPNSQKKTSLSFEDELVEGAAQKPDISYIFQKKNFNYKRLIKLRENFIPEMRRTSEDMQRIRREN